MINVNEVKEAIERIDSVVNSDEVFSKPENDWNGYLDINKKGGKKLVEMKFHEDMRLVKQFINDTKNIEKSTIDLMVKDIDEFLSSCEDCPETIELREKLHDIAQCYSLRLADTWELQQIAKELNLQDYSVSYIKLYIRKMVLACKEHGIEI